MFAVLKFSASTSPPYLILIHSSGNPSYRHYLHPGLVSLQSPLPQRPKSLPAQSCFTATPLILPLAPALPSTPAQRLASLHLQGLQRCQRTSHKTKLGLSPATQLIATLPPSCGSSPSAGIQTPLLSSGAVLLLGIQTKGQLLLSPTRTRLMLVPASILLVPPSTFLLHFPPQHPPWCPYVSLINFMTPTVQVRTSCPRNLSPRWALLESLVL